MPYRPSRSGGMSASDVDILRSRVRERLARRLPRRRHPPVAGDERGNVHLLQLVESQDGPRHRRQNEND